MQKLDLAGRLAN
jgi:hypothetical protein